LIHNLNYLICNKLAAKILLLNEPSKQKELIFNTYFSSFHLVSLYILSKIVY